MKKYNWAILGCGKIAEKFSSDLGFLENANLYATASRDLNKSEEFASKFGFEKAYGSYKEMLEDKKVDIVYVATPHTFHAKHTILSLQHDKAVLCEKPFAINYKEVEEMILKCKEKNVFLMEAFWTHFVPSFQKVLEIIKSNELGHLKMIQSDFMFHAPFNARSRLYDMELGGGALLDIGIYPVFAALVTLGVPKEIKAKAILSPTGSDEHLEVVFEYDEDAKKAYLVSGFKCDSFNDTIFHFEKGVVRISHELNDTVFVKKDGKIKKYKLGDGLGFGYQFEASHVMECLDNQLIESPILSHSFSLKLIKILDKIRSKIGVVYSNHD